MKIKITTENNLNPTNDVLKLFAKNNIDVKNIEATSGYIYTEAYSLEKSLERSIASQLMMIKGVKWVESISKMPTSQNNLFLKSILNAINHPVFAINQQGRINYQNERAKNCFKLTKKSNLKDIFVDNNWAKIIDTAAKEKITTNINTISGPMLVEVRATQDGTGKTNGAVLILHPAENIIARSLIIKGANLPSFNEIISVNLTMNDVVNRAKHMSNTEIPIMLYGEAGVGKKTLAQSIHQYSKRKNHLFSSIDLSNTKSLQIESELFGTPQTNNRAGLFEISDGGTVYIESIQELPNPCQIKLLNLIKNKLLFSMNGTQKKHIDVKIIASSPLPLKTYVDNNLFNKELFYALDINHLLIPPLRERKEDFEPLINSLLKQLKNDSDTNHIQLSVNALKKIKSYQWPGNLTELQNTLYKASLSTKDALIHSNELEIEGHVHLNTSPDNLSLPQAVADFEKHFLQHWYQKHTSTRKLASLLGVSHTTIAQKLNKYDIN